MTCLLWQLSLSPLCVLAVLLECGVCVCVCLGVCVCVKECFLHTVDGWLCPFRSVWGHARVCVCVCVTNLLCLTGQGELHPPPLSLSLSFSFSLSPSLSHPLHLSLSLTHTHVPPLAESHWCPVVHMAASRQSQLSPSTHLQPQPLLCICKKTGQSIILQRYWQRF